MIDLYGRVVAMGGFDGSDSSRMDVHHLPDGVYSVVSPGTGTVPCRFVLLRR